MFRLIRTLIERFQMWRRNERRISGALKGRIYGTIDTGTAVRVITPGATTDARARPIGKLVPSRIYCAKEDKWYTAAQWEFRTIRNKKNGRHIHGRG